MFRLLIAKAGVAYAAKTGGGTIANIAEVHLLAEGAIAVFGDDGTLLTSSTLAATIKEYSTFKVATGAASGIPNISIPIDRDAFLQRLTTSTLPVLQKTYVGKGGSTGAFNNPAIAANDEAGLKVIDTTLGTITPLASKRYGVTAKSGDSIATIVNKLITSINADSTSLVVATAVETTGVTTGIMLEAKSEKTIFRVALDGLLVNATKSEDGTNGALSRKLGQGTLAQIAEQERLSNPSLGMDNTAGQMAYWWRRPSEVAASGRYDQFDIQWKTESITGNKPAGMNVGTPTLTLALPNADATTTEVKAILVLVFKERSTDATTGTKKASA